MAGRLDYNAPLLSVHRSLSTRHKLATDETSHSSFDHSSHSPLVSPKQEPLDYVLPLPPGRSPAVVEEEKSTPPYSTLLTTVKLPPLPVLHRSDTNTGHHAYGQPSQNAAAEGEEERFTGTWKNVRTERPKSFSTLQPSTLKLFSLQARANYRETRRNSIDETKRLTSNVKVSALRDINAGDDATDVGKMGSEDEEERHQVSRTDPRARDFIMQRFLPAAQAMAADTTEASDRRLSLDSQRDECQPSQRPLTRFANIGRHNEEHSLGSVEALRRQRFRDSRLSRTSFRSSIRTSFHTAKCSSRGSLSTLSSSWRRGYEDDESVQSEDFWSDEGASEGRPKRSYQWTPYVSSDTEGMSPRSARRQDAILMTEMMKLSDSDNYYNIKTNRRMSLPADRKGFLGLPGNSDYRDSPRASEWGETHPVNRIGARLANVLGGTNNTTPVVRNVKNRPPKQQYHIEWTQEGDSDEESDSKDWQMVIRGPIKISMTDPVEDSSKKERPPMKPMFPPLPKSPSESWLCSAVPARKNQTKIPRAISLKSLPAAEVEGNTWESKALQCIEVSHNQSGRFGAPHILRS